MWIRSQNRRVLIKVNFAYVPPYEKSIWVPTENDAFSIGTYGTEERVLEVLSEIQKHIAADIRGPYQMPEE